MPTGNNGLASCYPNALVTGASSGIGAAIATGLVQAGVTVYGTSRHPGAPGLDKAIHWLPFDGASEAGISSFLAAQDNLLSKTYLLVNNAGSSYFGKASSIPEEMVTAQQSLLYSAPLQLIRGVLPGMLERRTGAVVNITSLASIFPLPYMEGYSAAKAGLSTYSQGLMNQLKGSGISVIDFQAGDFKTAFNRNIRRFGEADEAEERVWRRLEENIASAPPAEQAARDLLQALGRQRSAIIRSGGFFQKHLAPLGARLLPRRCLLWTIRRYYNLPS
jgi:short-subunit dehydrogenase